MPKEPKKGEMHPEFGFKVESDFHIVSKMKSHRYLDLLSNNLVLKTPNYRRTQTWYFSSKSKTIMNRSGNRALSIRGNGRYKEL